LIAVIYVSLHLLSVDLFLDLSAICIFTVNMSHGSGPFNVSNMQVRNQVSSLPYSVAFLEQISHLSNGTMEILRLPSPFPLTSVPLVSGTSPLLPCSSRSIGGSSTYFTRSSLGRV
jgi:hypothetical protein